MKKQIPNEPQMSETISSFLDQIKQAKIDYNWHKEQQHKMEKLTQDYLHQLELENLDYRGRAKVATELAKCRKERREHKDIVEALTPLIEFLENGKGKQLTGLMNKVLGKTRKAEEKLNNRIYWCRVLDGAIIQKEKS